MRQRPLAVTIIACIYILAGAIGFAYHASELASPRAPADLIWVELVRLLAVLAGIYLLRRADWARWLALAWMGFHVVLSAFHSVSQLAVHAVFFAAIAYFLLRPPS